MGKMMKNQKGSVPSSSNNIGRRFVEALLLYTWFPTQGAFALYPQMSIFFNIILSIALSQITKTDDLNLLDQAQAMISLVSTASISIVTLTFSLTVLSIQLASQQYTPRLLDDFLKDPVSKVVISVNVGAFAYCFTLNYFIYDETTVPMVAINVLSVHMLLVLTSFVGFIHFFLNGMRLEEILARSSLSSVNAARALEQAHASDLYKLPDVPTQSFKVMADASGYITRFKLESLVSAAEKMDICVRYYPQIGDYAVEGTLMAYVWDMAAAPLIPVQEDSEKDKVDIKKAREAQIQMENNGSSSQQGGDSEKKSDDNKDATLPLAERVIKYIREIEDKDSAKKKIAIDDLTTEEGKVEKLLGSFVARGVELSNTRSSYFDETLGVQQLADIAVRALSPGINDPQTAIQVMDVLFALLVELARSNRGFPHAKGSDGKLRVCMPRRTYSYLLSQLDSIRYYGATDLAVCRRGIRLFGDLGAIVTRFKDHDNENRISIVLGQLEQWMVVSRKNFPKRSEELKSLEALYEHALQSIAVSDSFLVADDEVVQKELQELETTHHAQGETDVVEDESLLAKAAAKVVELAS